MDLIIVKARSGSGMYVCSGSGREWLHRDDAIAIVPNAGWCQYMVSSGLTHEPWQPIRAPLAVVLGEVGMVLEAHRHRPTESIDEPWAVPDTICSACRREREPGAEPGTVCPDCQRRESEASPPPAPHPTDPNVPRLTTEALAQHTRAHERDRSRSPVRAASPSAEASR
jgi:hypothetical protein